MTKITLNVQALRAVISEDEEFNLVLRKKILSKAIKEGLGNLYKKEIEKEMKDNPFSKSFINAGLAALKDAEADVYTDLQEWKTQVESDLSEKFKKQVEKFGEDLETKLVVDKANRMIAHIRKKIELDEKEGREFNQLLATKLRKYFQDAIDTVFAPKQ